MHPLIRLVLGRLVALVPMLLALSIASFALVHVIPGDPALVIMGGEGTPQAVEELRRQLGLDRPLHVRYLEWLGQIARGDLGESLYNKTRVSEELVWRHADDARPGDSRPGVLGRPSACPPASCPPPSGTPGSTTPRAFSRLVSLSLPSFWLGLMLIILFSLWLDLLPIVGYEPITRGIWKAVPVPHPAEPLARHVPGGAPHAPHPVEHARGPEPGLRPHGAGEGPARIAPS